MMEQNSKVPLGQLVTLQTEKIFANKDPKMPYVGLEHIAQGEPRLLGISDSASSVSVNSIFQKDDILFGKLRPNLRKSLKAPFNGYCSTDILVLRSLEGVLPNFAGHVFQWERVFAAAVATAAGTKMPRTSWNDLKQFKVFKPDAPSEQSRIAYVLDIIDEAIAKTEAVIAKLKHVRTGMLHDLLSYGLDENGQLRDPIAHPEQFKDSPLGIVPKGWDVFELSKVIEVFFDYRGRTPLKLNMEWGGGDIPALSANNVEMGRINFDKETYYGSEKLYKKWMANGDTNEGDILITMEAPLGNIAQIPDEKKYILSQRVVLLRPEPEFLEKDFFALQLMAYRFQKELVRNSSGSTAVGIQRSKLEKIHVFVPRNHDEQKLITDTIHALGKDISVNSIELQKLQHIKSGLQDDLLTGQVRVPETIAGGAEGL